MAKTCPGFSLVINNLLNNMMNQILNFYCCFKSLKSSSPEIYELDIESTDKSGGELLRGMVIFGEHPRELISPETGLNFVSALCDES